MRSRWCKTIIFLLVYGTLSLARARMLPADEIRRDGRVVANVRYYNAQVSKMPAVQAELRVLYQNPSLPANAQVDLVSSEMRDVVLEDHTLKRQQFWDQTRIDSMQPIAGYAGAWSYTLQGAHESNAVNAFLTKDFAFYIRVDPKGGQPSYEVRGSEDGGGYFATFLSSPIFSDDKVARVDASVPSWKLANIQIVKVDNKKAIDSSAFSH